MTAPARKVRTLAEGDISFLEWEGTGPLLHFSHATGFNAETYRTILSPLAERFHIVASDLRGHGFSSLPAGIATDWRIYRDDLVQILAALHAPAILSGHSMGATVSLMVAAERPDLVKGIVLFEPVMIPRTAQLVRIAAHGIGRPIPNPLAEGAARRRDSFPSFEAALKAYTGRGAFKTWPQESLVDYLHGGLIPAPDGHGVRLACTPAWEAQTFRMTPFGASGLTRRVKCPIALVYGTLHSTCRDSEVKNFARAGARIVKVDGASHFLPMERPEVVREELGRMGELVGG
jgi:pimeloyl-ACP methyl ester carboxylesterase